MRLRCARWVKPLSGKREAAQFPALAVATLGYLGRSGLAGMRSPAVQAGGPEGDVDAVTAESVDGSAVLGWVPGTPW